MKGIFFAIFTVLISCQVALTRPSTEASLHRLEELRRQNLLLETCVERLREDLGFVVQDFGEWVVDMMRRLDRVRDIRKTCDNIQISDPPRPWELAQREACERALRTAIGLEVARIGVDLTRMILTYPPIIRESVESFLICINNDIPDTSEVEPSISVETSSYEKLLY